ncbi:hypothetical protein ACFO5Q_05070 [Kordiimonas lipolytica]|uniref:Uncharacterized protein n=1 Tax=Kordiimonas lipolytica TaxID=1662421 RepID=A0ABV8U9B4_9PROT|nr:hypothetical protein [Kordiimonas lipolytica]
MTKENATLIIGSLPPFRSAAAALGLSTAETLAVSQDVTFVIDDMAPEPPEGLPFVVIRLRDLQANWGTYQGHQRLYIPGSEGDSLFPLELLHMAPGVVMPATLSLFPLAESTCRAGGTWPDAYWRWLKDRTGQHASTLYTARVHHRRESKTQAAITPALDLLLSPATGLIAASPAMARMLTASGMTPNLVLDQPPVIAEPHTSDHKPPAVLYVAQEGVAAQACRKSLSVFDAFKDVSHLSIHPAARHLSAAIAEADIVAFLDGHDQACSPGLASAIQAQKRILTAGQPWTRHLSEGSHIALPHGKAHATLATSVAAVLSDKILAAHLAKHQTTKGADSAHALSTLLQATDIAQADLSQPAEEPASAPTEAGPKVAANIKTAALIGAVPPPAVLRELLPSLDIERSPHFCTPALAARLATLTGEKAASLLAKIGYEAPLILDSGHTPGNHRQPVTFESVRKGLKAQKAISFGCSVEGAADGDRLLEGAGIAPKLTLRIDFVETDRNAPTEGFLPDCGLFWRHDTVRHALQCVLVVGHRRGSFLLKAGAPDARYMIAGTGVSCAISGGTAATLSSDSLGLLEFRLMALDNTVGTPLGSIDLRKQLAQAGLILEWSAL